MEGVDAPLLPDEEGIEGMEGICGIVDGMDAPPPPPPELPEGMRELLLLPPELPPEGMLELLPPLLPEEPLEPPDDPLDPPEELGELGGGVLLGEGIELDCCSAQPPIRKLDTAPTAVICAATTSSRWIAWLLFIASLQVLAKSCLQVCQTLWRVVPLSNRATAQLNVR